MNGDLLILGWHNVEGTPCFPAKSGHGLVGLHRQLTTLARVASVVPLGPALADLSLGHRLPRRAVALTFDDGYADVAQLAVPLLERLGLPATFFLVPEFLDQKVTAWWETLAWAFAATSRPDLDWRDRHLRLDSEQDRARAGSTVAGELKRDDAATRQAEVDDLVSQLEPQGAAPGPDLFLDWSGARELVRRGFEVGSHTTAHAILSQESAAAQHADLATARRRLQDALTVPVDLLAYPNGRAGDFDAASIAAAQAAGHTHAITTIDGFHRAGADPYQVRRCVVYPERGVREIFTTGAVAWHRGRRPTPAPAPSDLTT